MRSCRNAYTCSRLDPFATQTAEVFQEPSIVSHAICDRDSPGIPTGAMHCDNALPGAPLAPLGNYQRCSPLTSAAASMWQQGMPGACPTLKLVRIARHGFTIGCSSGQGNPPGLLAAYPLSSGCLRRVRSLFTCCLASCELFPVPVVAVVCNLNSCAAVIAGLACQSTTQSQTRPIFLTIGLHTFLSSSIKASAYKS